MPTITAPHDLLDSHVYLDLSGFIGRNLQFKYEGFNFAGSIKFRAAVAMIAAAEKEGSLGPDTVLVESSSGNSGVALATIAASRGIPFICITDPRCNPATIKLMRALGAEVRVVDEAHPEAGYLQARLDAVAALCASDDRYLWLNQYANPANWLIHYETTAPEISRRYPRLDVLFVGVGTGGTAMGCARYFREARRPVRIVAIDAVGSVSFGAPAGQRLLPGIGASVALPLIEPSLLDDVVYVAEVDAVRHCRALARRGFVVGGSTGSVLAGALDWLRRNDPGNKLTSVAIAPDLGERYLDNVYDDHWVRAHYGSAALEPASFEGGTAIRYWHARKRTP
ncbi:2,3-diaminopropionate biosynthesis protein SbnA [Micromonospora orduensis]|uniref:N-(2-amino-2-carboxyethyl)-L-glutamate synthase n=1 Tax=Micromonospora orduensis TaxID=1420891 RepID=A0A5C4QD38_9ACTN|nr:2,3-diaminopropionate biosynthesis protein SbnA [Micromonospora orduensis]